MDKANQDLLVAVLAIMTDAIPRDAMALALKSWSEKRGDSVGEWLRTSAGVDDKRIRALECLARAHLEAHENDLRRSLTAWNALDLTQGVLTEIHDEAMRTTLGAAIGGTETIAANGSAQPGRGSSIAHFPRASGDGKRFRLLRPHAQGGIGQVWLARDSELQRDVALKEIQPRFAEREDQRARFLLEAEITGNLEHPGIVPVYSLGRNADGRPYYAMRFIRGESFSVAIRRFHQGRREPQQGAPAEPRPLLGIEFRQLIRRFLDVCDAMDYAHSRGVIHRDLKPANIMLGRYGETLVVDWGVAKVIGKSDIMAAGRDGEFEASFASATVSTSGDTQPGRSIGTPAYMSPEQVRGEIDALGAVSDVYNLGVTLYELLTGEVPYTGDQISTVLEQVLKGTFRHPRGVDAGIPAPLEAICLKAMAAEPARRYATARELAQDLEHWLADEPVAAYPERGLERLWRWLRHHRAWTNAAVAALLGITMAATIAAVVVEQLRRRETEARKEAESNFKMAQSAVDDYLTSVSENTLLKQQDSVDIRSLRQELLNNALSYYKGFVKQRGNDPLLRRQLANAYYRVGEITRVIGSLGDAMAAFQSAQALWEQLAAADPQDHELRGRLADCHLAIGQLQSSTDDFQAAMASLTRASAILESLAQAEPDVVSYQASLAACTMRIGIIQGELKSADQALGTLEKARAIQERVIRKRPGQSPDQILLAETILALGTRYYELHDYPAALRAFQDSRRICESEFDKIAIGPKPVRLLDILAISHYNSAAIERKNGQLEAALQSFEHSLKYRSSLVDAHPSVTQFQEQLGKNLAELALIEHDAHQDDKAAESITRSIEILEKLVQSQPDQPRFHHDLGRSWNIQGFFHDEHRRNGLAIQAFERAIALQSRATAAAPEVNLYKIEMCRQLDNLGEQYVDLGKVSEALPYYRREITIFEELLAARPGKEDYVLQLVEALSKLGSIERHNGDSIAAAESLAKARTVLEPLMGTDAQLRGRHGAILTEEAVALADLKKNDIALELLRQSVEILSHLDADSGSVDQTRGWQSESLWELARVLRAAGEEAKAEEADRERVSLWKNQPPAKLAALALRDTSQAVLIGYGKTPITDRARTIRDLDLDRAAAGLRLAISLGFTDLPMLRQNPDSWALLARADMVALLNELGSPHPAVPHETQKQH